MSKREGVRRVKLSDFKDRKENEGAVDIVTDDDQVFRLPPPDLWADEVMELLAKEELVAAAHLIMGPDRYQAYKEAGGTAVLLMSILKEEHGINLPE